MKLVINTCFGTFTIKRSIAENHGFDRYDESRTNEKLIELIESGVDCNGSCSELKVVDIPDETTDYRIIDHDDFFYDEGTE